MRFLLGIGFVSLFLGQVFSLRCYTCLNQKIEDCMKVNQSCSDNMNKCFSMQKKGIDGEWLYTKFCAGEWYCERSDAACGDLDEPEYSYMDCNVGCCTSHLCNHAVGTVFGKTINFLFGCLALLALLQYW